MSIYDTKPRISALPQDIQLTDADEKLFTLIKIASEHSILHLIQDECENLFDHRRILHLTEDQKYTLYAAARPSVIKEATRVYKVLPATVTLQ